MVFESHAVLSFAFNVCNFLPNPPPTPPLVELLLFLLTPYGSNKIAFTPEDFHKIWVFLPEEYGSTTKNFVEFKASPTTTLSPSPAKEIVFFYSTPKQILNFLNLSLNNSIGPQPGVKDVKCSSLSILLLT